MLNPLEWVVDRIVTPISDYPRVRATHDCEGCGAKYGHKHRLSTCDGNSRDIQRRFLVDYPGEVLTDEEVDRRFAAALERHRKNEAEKEG